MADYTTTAPTGEEATVYVEDIAYLVTYLSEHSEVSNMGVIYDTWHYDVECVWLEGHWHVAENALSKAMMAELNEAVRTLLGRLVPMRRSA